MKFTDNIFHVALTDVSYYKFENKWVLALPDSFLPYLSRLPIELGRICKGSYEVSGDLLDKSGVEPLAGQEIGLPFYLLFLLP